MVMVVQIFVSTFMYLCTFASHKPKSSLQPHGLISCEVKSNTRTGSSGKLIDEELLKMQEPHLYRAVRIIVAKPVLKVYQFIFKDCRVEEMCCYPS